MAMSIWRWIGRTIHLRRLDHLERTILELEGRMRRVLRRFAKDRRRLASLERLQRLIAETVAEDVEVGEQIQRQYSETIDQLRAELTVEKQSVKAMTRAHELAIARLDADLSVQERRRAGATPAEREGYLP